MVLDGRLMKCCSRCLSGISCRASPTPIGSPRSGVCSRSGSILMAAPAVEQPDPVELLRVGTVAKLLKLSKPRVYELLRAQEIPAVRIASVR